jgi:lysozyme
MLNCVIDISHFQDPEWAILRESGVVGVIHKASEGGTYKDPLYAKHMVAAQKAGLLWGAYHLGNNTEVTEQVKNFLTSVAPGEIETLLCLQWQDMGGGSSSTSAPSEPVNIEEGEHPPSGELEEGKQEPVSSGSSSGSKTMSLDQVRQFVTLVAEQQGGVYPVVCSGSVAKRELSSGVDPILAKCPFWLIQWEDAPSDIPPTFKKTFALWQHTDGQTGLEPHEAPGVGPCFRDRFNGTEAELAAFWGKGKPEQTEKAKKAIAKGPVSRDKDEGRSHR